MNVSRANVTCGREEVVFETYSGDETVEIAAEIPDENGRGQG